MGGRCSCQLYCIETRTAGTRTGWGLDSRSDPVGRGPRRTGTGQPTQERRRSATLALTWRLDPPRSVGTGGRGAGAVEEIGSQLAIDRARRKSASLARSWKSDPPRSWQSGQRAPAQQWRGRGNWKPARDRSGETGKRVAGAVVGVRSAPPGRDRGGATLARSG
jgi:hypothetical protein